MDLNPDAGARMDSDVRFFLHDAKMRFHKIRFEPKTKDEAPESMARRAVHQVPEYRMLPYGYHGLGTKLRLFFDSCSKALRAR